MTTKETDRPGQTDFIESLDWEKERVKKTPFIRNVIFPSRRDELWSL